jgi:hypothetical protein
VAANLVTKYVTTFWHSSVGSLPASPQMGQPSDQTAGQCPRAPEGWLFVESNLSAAQLRL